jgi:hypothetical protein
MAWGRSLIFASPRSTHLTPKRESRDQQHAPTRSSLMVPNQNVKKCWQRPSNEGERGVTFRVAAVAGIGASELGNIGVWIDVTPGAHRVFTSSTLKHPGLCHALVGVASHQRRVSGISSSTATLARPATAECLASIRYRGCSILFLAQFFKSSPEIAKGIAR